ncbi:MAG: prepilin-type N-terminal cleavage/methylation domain-containing protein [Bdellovibrionales bacterium]|nr:prepilin-type N-terminal cleavage/methylation domain-containing protein [Bdellovibrionales bacterium]
MSKKQQGFSLLEVMVALAVVSFLSFTVLQLIFTNLKATKAVELAASLDNLTTEVSMALKDPAVCQSNLANFATTTLPSPLEGGAIGLTQVTLPAMTKPLVINNASLANEPSTKIALSIDTIKQITTVSYLANINFNLDKGQGFLGARNIVRRIPIALTLASAGGEVTGCSTFGTTAGGTTPGGSGSSTTPAEICALLGQALDPKTGLCAGANEKEVTLEKVCASVGGTYNEDTQKCTVAVVASGGNPPPTPTPKLPCAGATTACGGQNFTVPELNNDGFFSRDWIASINSQNTRCQLFVRCSATTNKWISNTCNCQVVK